MHGMNIKIIFILNCISVCAVIPVEICVVWLQTFPILILKVSKCFLCTCTCNSFYWASLCSKIERANDEIGFNITNSLFWFRLIKCFLIKFLGERMKTKKHSRFSGNDSDDLIIYRNHHIRNTERGNQNNFLIK
jgi:hypothetical protein